MREERSGIPRGTPWWCECWGKDAIIAEGGGDDGEKGAVDQRDGREGRSNVLDWDICHAASLAGYGSGQCALVARGTWVTEE